MQQWLGEKLSPNEWGWKQKDFFYPVSMTEPPAPEKLLQSLFCSCKVAVKIAVVVEKLACTAALPV